MRWIGLTGGIATGKSTVAEAIVERGIPVIDADQLSREIFLPRQKAYDDVVEAFGRGILAEDAESIDRKKLGDIVFRDRSQLEKLEQLTHPHISQLAHERRQKLAHEGHKIAFYMVPLLFENNLKTFFDEVVVIACSEATQRERLITRDLFTHEEAQMRLDAQIPISEKVLLADHVIENNLGLEELETAVEKFLDGLV